MEHLTTLPLSALPQVRVLGRHADRQPQTLFWTGSGIELRFTGSDLWVEWNAGYDIMEPWVSVELDGAWVARFAVNPGRSRSCIFRGMAPGRPKHVRILKDAQAMYDDPAHFLQIEGLTFAEGEFLPLDPPRHRIEFVGDSITSGEGAIGTQGEQDWTGVLFSARNNYARLTADALGAEYRVVSQSGWGIVAGFDNDPRHALPAYYTRVCGVARGDQNRQRGAQEPYDFAAWQPDAVVIHLGTNDDHAFANPPWVDPVTGQASQLHSLPDGTFDPKDAARVEQGVRDFLALVRRHNPQAVLVWCYGMMGCGLLPVIRAGLEDHFMGKLTGIPMGCDACYTNHMKADQNDIEDLAVLLTAAGCNYFMGIPHGDDVMLNYQTTGFHETAALREMFGLTAIPPFQRWLEDMGFVENGKLTPLAGDASVLLG